MNSENSELHTAYQTCSKRTTTSLLFNYSIIKIIKAHQPNDIMKNSLAVPPNTGAQDRKNQVRPKMTTATQTKIALHTVSPRLDSWAHSTHSLTCHTWLNGHLPHAMPVRPLSHLFLALQTSGFGHVYSVYTRDVSAFSSRREFSTTSTTSSSTSQKLSSDVTFDPPCKQLAPTGQARQPGAGASGSNLVWLPSVPASGLS